MTYYEIMQQAGKRIHPKLYYYDNANTKVEIDRDNIESIKLSFNAPLTGSVATELTAELKVSLPDTAIYFQNTATYNGTNATKTYGPFYLKETPSFNADSKTYDHTMYDGFLKAMVDYKPITITYPTTVLAFFQQLCLACGYTTNITSLPNGSRTISMDIYEGINYTYRDVFDDIANATGSLFKCNNGVIEKCPLGTSAIAVDDDLLKNQNIELGEHFGPINAIVLSRTDNADNIYKRDETLTSWNEYKISDNQLMNDNNRSDYLDELYNALYGIEYDIFDLELVGYGGFNPLDKITITTNNATYNSYVFNNEITITQGIEECIYTEMPEESTTDYKTSDTTDKRINQAYIMVNKQNQTINALASEVSENSEKTAELEITVNQIQQQVSESVTLTKELTQNNTLTIEDAFEGDLLKFSIVGNMSLLYPSDNLYPSNDLYPLDSYLIIENEDGTQRKIHLPLTYLNYLNAEIYDEFVVENGQAKIIRRVGETSDGTLYALGTETTENKGDLNISVVNGYNKIWLESFYDIALRYYTKYVYDNDYTEVFATKVEMNSSISQTKEEINLEVSKKVDETEVVSTINQSAEQITLSGNRLVVNANNFNLTADGTVSSENGIFTNATINGGELKLQNGAQVTGDNGLLTNLIYPGYVRGAMFNGSGDYLPLGHVGGGFDSNTQRNALVFAFKLPSNFTIQSAKVHLIHCPINWSMGDWSGTGYSRNLNLYKINSTSLNVDMNNYYAPYNSSYSLISGVLNFNPSAYGISTVESTDIKSQISTTSYNQLAVMTSDDVQSGNANIFGRTGGVVGYIEIIGFKNY